MKTISLSVPDEDYEAFRRAAASERTSVARLVREAMGYYRQARLDSRPPLRELPVLMGHRQLTPLPSRSELYDEIYVGEIDAVR